MVQRGGVRCENLENQTFTDESFDIVVTTDVMEHVYQPELAYREVFRTLRPGGLYVHSVPIYKELVRSVRYAALDADGKITYLVTPPEYHGNPVDDAGSLVTHHYGYEHHSDIAEWTGFDVEIIRFNDRTHGIVGEFTEIVVCRKPILRS